ncbi:MAG: YkgJ family cysteine cluster protein [Desulfobacteria bacterium]
MTDNILDKKDLDKSRMEPMVDGKFSFACHPGVPCFTKCCSDLDLALTPYDVLLLKNRLEVSSSDFLDRYTTDEVRHNCGLPVLMLKMKNDSKRTCPLLQSEGCTVYEDRPGACRLYPVARAAKYVGGTVKEQHFLVKEPHCLGFHEDKEWTDKEWLENQGLELYNEMNSLWMKINQSSKENKTPPPITDEKLKMYFMACYNLDAFKRFVFESGLLNLFQIDKRTVSRIRTDETELLKFAFNWLEFAIFGKKTMKPKKSVIKTKKRAMGRR